MPKIKAAYLRRSSVSEDNQGEASHAAQLHAVRLLAGDDVEIYEDWGISGLKANRPDYIRLKDDIAAGKVESVAAYSLSRLGRKTRELLDFVDLCQDHHVSIRTAVESLDTASAMGRAMLTIVSAFAQLEAELARERQASARAARIARGDDMSAPWGYRLVKQDDGSLKRVRDEEEPLEVVLDAYRQAGSILGAARLLEEWKILAPRGGEHWATSAVARIVDRELPGARTRRGRDGDKLPTRSVLSGLVTCPACGRKMTPVGTRSALYCPNGSRDKDHGKAFTKDGPILAMLHAATDGRTYTRISLFRKDTTEMLQRAEDRWRRANVRYQSGGIGDAEFLAEAERWREAEQQASDEAGFDYTKLEGQPWVRWELSPAEVNADLRRRFLEVRLDPKTLAPVALVQRRNRVPGSALSEEGEVVDKWDDMEIRLRSYPPGHDKAT